MRIIAPQKPLPKGLSGIYVLQDVKGHKIKPLAISVCEEIDASYSECGEGFKAADGNQALYIKDRSGEIVSFIVWTLWTLEPEEKTAWIGTAWTRADHRGNGLYRELYGALKIVAKEHGMPSIGAGVYARNTASRAAHESFGMVPTVLYYTQVLT
jgi:RimJ/RimL family protein N-acetyltransferase